MVVDKRGGRVFLKKKLILLAAPPACGKNYVSELLCNAMGSVAYFDKDDLAPLLRRSFALCGEAVNMDGKFYSQNLRSYEYETLMRLAFSALRFSDKVLVNAPLLKEVRDEEYMRSLKKRAEELDAELILVWVSASTESCRRRMQARNSDRDRNKLADWDAYVQGIDYSAPQMLEECGAVDKLLVFDNEDAETAKASLLKIMERLEEKL